MKKAVYTLITILIVTSVMLEAAVIFLTNEKAGESIGVSEMKHEIAQYEEENKHLKEEMLKYSSLRNIASRAAELGFSQDTEFISLSGSERFAASR